MKDNYCIYVGNETTWTGKSEVDGTDIIFDRTIENISKYADNLTLKEKDSKLLQLINDCNYDKILVFQEIESYSREFEIVKDLTE